MKTVARSQWSTRQVSVMIVEIALQRKSARATGERDENEGAR
jgi:hypothetical protein